ncbi:MAG: hypothetical protein GXO19_03225 [Epsilonproteobacteria bacterium]|nr:hypothetical protein [Campylobacterota bacterium]NPA56729.1 hypothetical protein [Campylobacterota bacterium]
MVRFVVLSAILLQLAHALPQFAREYQTDCSTCHTNIPMLNETGESFLRNGFRFSPEDLPSLKEFIVHGERQYEPFGALLGLTYRDKTERESLSGKVKLYFAGTLNKTISLFASSRQNINTKNPRAPKLFEEQSSRAYIQLVHNEPDHLLRAGLMLPFTQWGNLARSFTDSGLHGIMRGIPGREQYRSPLQRTGLGSYKGAEYSYLHDGKLLFLISYGDPTDHGEMGGPKGAGSMGEGGKGSGKGGSGQTGGMGHQTDGKGKGEGKGRRPRHLGGSGGSPHSPGGMGGKGGMMGGKGGERPSGDDSQLMAGVRYLFESGWKVGLLYGEKEERGISTQSIIVPIERGFDPWYITSILVFSDNERKGEYRGIENSITYRVGESSFLRAIVNYGLDSDDNSEEGYSLTYSAILNNFAMIHLIGAYAENLYGVDDTQFKVSFNIFF